MLKEISWQYYIILPCLKGFLWNSGKLRWLWSCSNFPITLDQSWVPSQRMAMHVEFYTLKQKIQITITTFGIVLLFLNNHVPMCPMKWQKFANFSPNNGSPPLIKSQLWVSAWERKWTSNSKLTSKHVDQITQHLIWALTEAQIMLSLHETARWENPRLNWKKTRDRKEEQMLNLLSCVYFYLS